MTYTTVVTSKGTITIAAPLRKALGIEEGQKITMALNDKQQLVLSTGTTIKEFIALRDKIMQSVPDHLKGLSGEALREARAKAWVADYVD